MKRILGLALFGALTAVLGGCPIYPDGPDNAGPSGGPGEYRVCTESACYYCPSEVYSPACQPWTCGNSYDCPNGYVCSSDRCVSGPGTTDASTGDCSTTGCPAGLVCELAGGTLQCVYPGGTPDGGTKTDGGTQADSGPDASPVDSGVACQTNAECAAGSLCLDGVCVPPPDQCFDGTQCPSGDKCVQGACTPTCTVLVDGGAMGCPTGYACVNVDDAAASSVCTGNPTPCESDPTVCTGGTVCAQNHCVTPCGAGGTCPTGDECVQGGCVPNQNPLFTCSKDGVQDACASGSICLHHSCYIACSPDAGAAACQSADQFNQCKPVTTSSGTYDVCGSSTNLGTECSPTQACAAPGAICIDGFCH